MKESIIATLGVGVVAAASSFAAPPDKGAASAPLAQEKRQDDLADRLLRKAKSDPQEGLMEAVIRLMETVSRRMGVEFDVGEQTLDLQAEITARLDEAIERAAKQRRPQRRASPRSNPDRRRMPTASGGGAGKQKGSTAGKGAKEPTNGAAGDGVAEPVEERAGEFVELRRGWGTLPSRERDELIQGIEEKYLERYRKWIERYYRALQEVDE